MQITKTIRLTGESAESIEGAIAAVPQRAATSLRGVRTYEVVRVAVYLDDETAWAHEVTCDVTFGVKDATAHG